MQKLAVSKKIMDKHNGTPRNQSGGSLPMSENINATYSVPQDMLQQQVPQQQVPQSTNNGGPVTENAIKNSKLPDDIKKLMLENPIVQPQSNSPALTDDIIQGATRLMNNNTSPQTGPLQNESNTVTSNSPTIPNNNDLKSEE